MMHIKERATRNGMQNLIILTKKANGARDSNQRTSVKRFDQIEQLGGNRYTGDISVLVPVPAFAEAFLEGFH